MSHKRTVEAQETHHNVAATSTQRYDNSIYIYTNMLSLPVWVPNGSVTDLSIHHPLGSNWHPDWKVMVYISHFAFITPHESKTANGFPYGQAISGWCFIDSPNKNRGITWRRSGMWLGQVHECGRSCQTTGSCLFRLSKNLHLRKTTPHFCKQSRKVAVI